MPRCAASPRSAPPSSSGRGRRSEALEPMIAGLHVESGPEAVVVAADRPLRTLSSAVLRGGLAEARAIVNVHVERGNCGEDPDGMVEAYARRRGLAAPWVGLLTGARTQDATIGEEAAEGFHALVIVTVGLSNRWAPAGPPSRAGPRRPSTRSSSWKATRSRRRS